MQAKVKEFFNQLETVQIKKEIVDILCPCAFVLF